MLSPTSCRMVHTTLPSCWPRRLLMWKWRGDLKRETMQSTDKNGLIWYGNQWSWVQPRLHQPQVGNDTVSHLIQPFPWPLDGRTLVNSIYSGTRRCAGIGHCFRPNAKVVDIPERLPCKHEVASEHWANLLINDGLDMSETVIPHLPGEGC